jgi:adenylate kinase family enzyme
MEERKVLVFGRTGSGKSTIAQMLTHGELLVDDDHSTSFQASSSARGKTRDIVKHTKVEDGMLPTLLALEK